MYVFPSASVLTLKHGGNVLVPCYPSGTIYDLFEILSVHLDQCGLSSASMYFVSPVANHSLAYSNIYAEWCVQRYCVVCSLLAVHGKCTML